MIDEIDSTGDGCPVCGSRRWWPSRTGRRICQACYRDPLEAIHALAEAVRPNGADASDSCLETAG